MLVPMHGVGDLRREQELRTVVFAWLDEKKAALGEVLPFSALAEGVTFDGRRQPVMHRQRGIYRPERSAFALTLRSSLSDPYGDRFDEADGTLVYGMESGGPDSPGNRAVIAAFTSALPVVYLRQVGSRANPRFSVIHPAWVVGVLREEQTFRVETSDAAALRVGGASLSGEFGIRLERMYATRRIRARLHQAGFRELVLDAYRSRCAMCCFRERQLLEAAHIVPDSDAGGDPIVSNGLALCRIHHGAFDAHLISIHPERLEIRVLPRLLSEEDGPMLRHGIQGLEGVQIQKPVRSVDRPDPERLTKHWQRFQELAVG